MMFSRACRSRRLPARLWTGNPIRPHQALRDAGGFPPERAGAKSRGPLSTGVLAAHLVAIQEDKAMSQHTAAIPTVTAAEQAFLRHFNAETFQARRGPAISWLDDHGLDWNGMAVFQRWGALHDERSVLGIDDDPLPPFRSPLVFRGGIPCESPGTPGDLYGSEALDLLVDQGGEHRLILEARPPRPGRGPSPGRSTTSGADRSHFCSGLWSLSGVVLSRSSITATISVSRTLHPAATSTVLRWRWTWLPRARSDAHRK